MPGMKTLLAAVFVFAGSSAWASAKPLAWSDIAQEDISYSLTQKIEVAPGLSFAASENFQLVSVDSGGSDVPVVIYEMAAKSCAFPDKEAEMVLIQPQSLAKRDSSVGVELHKQCHLVIYVEEQDIISPSFFAETAE